MPRTEAEIRRSATFKPTTPIGMSRRAFNEFAGKQGWAWAIVAALTPLVSVHGRKREDFGAYLPPPEEIAEKCREIRANDTPEMNTLRMTEAAFRGNQLADTELVELAPIETRVLSRDRRRRGEG